MLYGSVVWHMKYISIKLLPKGHYEMTNSEYFIKSFRLLLKLRRYFVGGDKKGYRTDMCKGYFRYKNKFGY